MEDTRTHLEVRDLPDGRDLADAAAADVTAALAFFDKQWKLRIMFNLFGGKVLRYSDLERAMPGISQKMLAQQLKQMQRDGLVERTVHPQVPPKVEYQLTAWGQALCPALDALLKWGARRPEAPPTDP